MAKAGMSGAVQMNGRVLRVAKNLPPACGAALYVEFEIEMTEAKEITPVRDGHLKRSGKVLPPRREGNSIIVEGTFGDETIDYAIYVHEDLDAFHTTGEAKFFESTLRASAPFIGARVARRMDLGRL